MKAHAKKLKIIFPHQRSLWEPVRFHDEEPMTCSSKTRLVFSYFFTELSKNLKVVMLINGLNFTIPVKVDNHMKIEKTSIIALNYILRL
jgi:hypothetical protein